MWMNKATGWMVVSLGFFMSAPLSLAAEVANTKACDEITQEVRKGRPGVAPVTVVDGKGPTDSGRYKKKKGWVWVQRWTPPPITHPPP